MVFEELGEKYLSKDAVSLFGKGASTEPTVGIKTLHAKIGQLKLDHDFSEGYPYKRTFTQPQRNIDKIPLRCWFFLMCGMARCLLNEIVPQDITITARFNYSMRSPG